MAIGDVVASFITPVISGNAFNIRPPSGNEWIVHNIAYDNGIVDFYKVDSSGGALMYDSDTSAGGRFNGAYHCTNDVWYQLKNSGSVTINMSYDGVQSK